MSDEDTARLQTTLTVSDLKRDIEALLFASGGPLCIDDILRAVGSSDIAVRHTVETILQQLAAEFPREGQRGFELAQLAGGWAFRTNPLAEDSIKALFAVPFEAGRLSPAAMECLAIVAYLQPVSRRQIAEVRGVDSDSPIRNLLDRELIEDAGLSQPKGGAVLFATTKRFEVMFGLKDLQALPALEEFALNEESRADLRRRLGLLTVPE